MTPVAEMVGSNRVVPGNGICTPLGDPGRSRDEERAVRRQILQRALEVLGAPAASATSRS